MTTVDHKTPTEVRLIIYCELYIASQNVILSKYAQAADVALSSITRVTTNCTLTIDTSSTFVYPPNLSFYK
jgi:hypothetical protein